MSDKPTTDESKDATKTRDAHPTQGIIEDPLTLYNLPRQDISKAELDLLKLFWRRGKLSAREVHDATAASTGWAYTTTRTTLDRMVKKDLLHRKAFHGLYLYAAAVGKVATLARLAKEFAERVLELDSVPIATLFSHSDVLNEQELEELEATLERAERAEHDDREQGKPEQGVQDPDPDREARS